MVECYGVPSVPRLASCLRNSSSTAQSSRARNLISTAVRDDGGDGISSLSSKDKTRSAYKWIKDRKTKRERVVRGARCGYQIGRNTTYGSATSKGDSEYSYFHRGGKLCALAGTRNSDNLNLSLPL